MTTRLHEYFPKSIERWLGVHPSGTSHRFRAAALGTDGLGLAAPDKVAELWRVPRSWMLATVAETRS